jgi:hypothetical protein
MSQYIVVEKKNHLAVHLYATNAESAKHWIANEAVEYCAKGYFMNKTLTPKCFEVVGRTSTALR